MNITSLIVDRLFFRLVFPSLAEDPYDHFLEVLLILTFDQYLKPLPPMNLPSDILDDDFYLSKCLFLIIH